MYYKLDLEILTKAIQIGTIMTEYKSNTTKYKTV